MNWYYLNINDNQIITQTDTSILIKCPSKSTYCGYSFWFPLRLLKNGRNKVAKCIIFSDNFEIRLLKYGKGKYNKYKVLDSILIDIDEFKDIFECTDLNIIAPKSKYETYIPELKHPVKDNLINNLIDNEED